MASRPAQRQLEELADFLERNPGIARGLLRTQQAKVETRRKWQEFASAVNCLGGVVKDGPAWAKYWAEKKCALKKLCQQQAQAMRRTGGGTEWMPQISQLEQRLVAVMGGNSFATGDTGLAVDPFPQSSLEPTNQSTSLHAAELEVENSIEIPPHPSSPQQVPIEASQTVEIRQQLESNHVQTATGRTRRGQSRQGHRVSFLDSQVRRFEEIESRRVDAETHIAQALTTIATAITEMARLLAVYLDRMRP